MDAQAEYRRRLNDSRQCAEAGRRRDLRFGAAKLGMAAGWVAAAWLSWVRHWWSGLWVALAFAVLAALFVLHAQAIAARARAERAVRFYQRGLARLQGGWSGTGAAGERFRDPEHPYADDLDLFGPGSLFELLSTARTPMGEECLAAWMRSPAEPGVIAERQRQVAAWRNELELREAVASVGDDLKQELRPARLAQWAIARSSLQGRAVRAAYALVAVGAVAALLYGLGTARMETFFGLVALEVVLVYRRRSAVEETIADLGANGQGLRLFAEILSQAPGAKSTGGVPALRRLAKLADWIEASESMIGRILDYVVLYSLQLGYFAEAWRRRYGPQMASWLQTVGEFEALLSLASHAYEHPGDPFPEVVPGAAMEYEGKELGHPLLPEEVCVRNSVRLDESTRLLLVSGSNMSGKSTLLRTVGVNAVLAQMGGPVRARSLRLTPLALGTRLRTADSLQKGRSGFYAEILRLRQVVELTAGRLPLLFLFDELLEGTNSHDRVVGAAGLLRALLAQPALGLVTTHDLSLTALAEELGPAVRNVHLEDQIEGNDVHFDHKLRDGVVTKSNALALMRIIGLKV